MRLSLLGIALFGLALAQDHGPTSDQLEQMDRFSTQPGTRIAWSQQVDRIEVGPSVALVNAIILEDTGRTPRIIRGVQIVLNGEGKRDRIYVSEEYAELLISALDEVATASPAFLQRSSTASKCFGTGAFLYAMRTGAHFFFPSQCEMADGWRGLSVYTGIETFRFTDIDTVPFARAIRAGMNALRQR